MYRTSAAIDDYRAVWDYMADRAGEEIADGGVRGFETALAVLADHPRAGPGRPELRPGVRSFPVGSYVLYHRVRPDGIELIRVLHGARDVRSLLRKKPQPT